MRDMRLIRYSQLISASLNLTEGFEVYQRKAKTKSFKHQKFQVFQDLRLVTFV